MERQQKDAAKRFGAEAASQDGGRGEAWVSGVAAGVARSGEVPPVDPETICHPPAWSVADETQLCPIPPLPALDTAGPPWKQSAGPVRLVYN